MTLTDAYLEFTLAKDWSPATRIWYRDHLLPFIRWCEAQGATALEDLTAPLIRRFIEYRRTLVTPSKGRPIDSHSLHAHVRCIRAFLNWAVADDLLDERLPKRITLPKKEQKILPVLSPEQVRRLLAAAELGSTPARDTAVLMVLLDSGLRASELCGLELGDVHLNPEETYLTIRKAKGRKVRQVPLGRKSSRALARYVHRHRPHGPHGGQAVFLARGDVPLTTNGLSQLIERLILRAGVEHFAGLRRGPHTFRHTFAVRFLEAGGGIFELSRIMGHESTQTTELYLRAVTDRQIRQKAVSPLDAL